MAMTFTLVTVLRERLLEIVKNRLEEEKRTEAEKERRLLEASRSIDMGLCHNLMRRQEEEAKTKGTPVTVESFKAWKAKFDKERMVEKKREEEELLKTLSIKERDEVKKLHFRLTGELRSMSYGLTIFL